MELIKWLTNEDLDNTPSFVIVIIVVCVVIFETTVLLKMFLPVWLQKRDGFKSSAKKPLVKNSHLVKILARLDEIDKRLDKHYEYIKEAAVQSGVSVVWTPGVPFIELVKAAFLNIKLGANGNLREKLLKAIMKEPNGRTIYQSILSAYVREHENVGSHFNETVKWIEKRIDGGY
jgi:hypothetical protein